MIFGKSYRVLATKDPERIQKVAKVMDHKMREIAEQLPEASPHAIAVLAGLNLADEWLSLQEETCSEFQALDQKILNIVKDIDIKLSDKAGK
jgi:cell division protein ZapA (FtsZ GTPase activity inhibitor)